MEHIPVLLKESINGLNIKPNGIYVDGTLGRAGHAIEIVKKLTGGQLLAVDRDEEALKKAAHFLLDYKDKITFIHGNFREIEKIISKEGIKKVDGLLFDLGVSSPQLDDPTRGFSYMRDAFLDMRMDEKGSLSAFDIVNNWSEHELCKVFYEYGQERYAKLIVREIIKNRVLTPIDTTFRLNDIIISALPAAARREAQHPSKRCFQALRIAVNDELGSLKDMLEASPRLLKPEGRLCVISFHSLEDRLVKKAFIAAAKECICPREIPVCVCGITPTLRMVTRKPITTGNDEIKRNPRARSAKLRIAERL